MVLWGRGVHFYHFRQSGRGVCFYYPQSAINKENEWPLVKKIETFPTLILPSINFLKLLTLFYQLLLATRWGSAFLPFSSTLLTLPSPLTLTRSFAPVATQPPFSNHTTPQANTQNTGKHTNTQPKVYLTKFRGVWLVFPYNPCLQDSPLCFFIRASANLSEICT